MFEFLLNKIKRKAVPGKLGEPLIFIHLEKTAGTTFQSYLRSLMPSADLIAKSYYYAHTTIQESFGDRSKRLYMGHISYRACQALNLRGYYLTFLREPFARAFSLYSYHKDPALLPSLMGVLNSQEVAAIRTVQEMTFQEYVLSDNILIYRHIKNLMSRRLALASHKRGVLRLETAFDVLANNFYWFGITEEFDKSIQLLNSTLLGRPNSKVGMIVERNISPKYDNTLDEKGLQRLRELNEYDLKLYENARALFYERYQRYGIEPDLPKPWTVQEIQFNPPRSEIDFYVRGLSTVEHWGTWSEGSVVTFLFTRPLPSRFSLSLSAKAFGPNAGKAFMAQVGDNIVPFKLKRTVSKQQLEFNNPTESKMIVFHVPVPSSPKELGEGEDARKLGMGLITLRITPRD